MIKAIFAVITCGVAFWLLVISPPDDLVREMPYHRELGYGFAAFGILFAVAVISKQFRFFFGIVLSAAVAGVFTWFCTFVPVNDWRGEHYLSAAFAALFALISVGMIVYLMRGNKAEDAYEK